jgi:hypothetical protein
VTSSPLLFEFGQTSPPVFAARYLEEWGVPSTPDAILVQGVTDVRRLLEEEGSL